MRLRRSWVRAGADMPWWPDAISAPQGQKYWSSERWRRPGGCGSGDRVFVGQLGPQRLVGFAEGPDNVGFPLAKPRFYIARSAIEARFGPQPDPRTNLAEIWLRDPRYLNEVLVQARATELRPERRSLRHSRSAFVCCTTRQQGS